MAYKSKEAQREAQRKYKKANQAKINSWNREWAAKRRKEDPNFKSRENAASRKWYRNHPQMAKAARQSNPHLTRDAVLRRKYGISQAEYDAMLRAQGGGCAICGNASPESRHKFFCVDHDHRTGRTRRLLCDPCNIGLGKFKDSPELLRRAAIYLEEHRVPELRVVV